MKSKEVLNLLKVTRVTLMNYVKTGKIKATKMKNGLYDYDDVSVFAFLKKDMRYSVIYCRVSTYKQKDDLKRQVENVVNYCELNKLQYSFIYKEIASGTNLDRKEFSILLNNVIAYKIKTRHFFLFKINLSRVTTYNHSRSFTKTT